VQKEPKSDRINIVLEEELMSSNKLITVHQSINNKIIGTPIYIFGVGAGRQGKITVRLIAQEHDKSLL
jgi:hypothetical protein